MKKVLMFVGGAVLLGIVAIAIRIALYAPEGRRLDASSKEYAVHLLNGSLKTWNAEAVKAEASEELLSAMPGTKLQEILGYFAGRLGAIQSHEEPKGESFRRTHNMKTVTTADYITPVSFEKGKGQIALRFILKEDKWQLLALNVNSDLLFQSGEVAKP